MIQFGGFLLASHPRAVRGAIEAHRRGLDANPVHYLHERGPGFEASVLREAARYVGGSPADIALTDSTTMGLGLLFNGIDLRAGQEALTTRHDFPATRAALQLKAERTGASVRTISLYDERSETITEDRLVEHALAAVRPNTRVLTLTWVHSSTGVKMPVRRVADGVAAINAGRGPRDRVLLCVDGVHGFGVENVAAADLGCDFFVAGCHKWLGAGHPMGLAFQPRRGSQSFIEKLAGAMMVAGDLDDPLLTFTSHLERGRRDSFNETVDHARRVPLVRAPLGARASVRVPPSDRAGPDRGPHPRAQPPLQA